ncbi:MAG: lycopene cyclase domain-containing protein [Geodermatophilaceae bacterium]
MSYTALSVVGVVLVLGVDLGVLRTRLVRRRVFWTAYAIVVFFQLIVNGVLTGRRVVTYDPGAILGPRVVFAPVEDLLFGFALILLTLSTWIWLGRHRVGTGTGRQG